LSGRGRPSLGAEDLDRFEALDGVALDTRAALLERAEEQTIASGEVLIRQGEANDRMFLLLEGRLGVFLDALDAEPVAALEPGAVVGELSMLDGGPASASVVATAPSRLLALDEPAFWALINDSHAFAVNLLTTLAHRLRANNASVSRNVAERRRFERAALFDGLTGVHNRRWLDDTLHRLVARYERDPGQLALALADIDHFKRFNDRFGHGAGDQVLVSVARAMARTLRPTDLVARFGGEEFVILFPDTTLEDASRAAERVRAAVETEQIQIAGGATLPPVTLSIGLAAYRPGRPVPALLLDADQAMYRAKAAGRNRVVTAI
jgi:diguanylate cyclase (GGDEF)-like protein